MVSDDTNGPDEPQDPETASDGGTGEDETDDAWDAGIEDTPEVAEAWGSVIDDAPPHDGGAELGERIEHDVSRGGVRRTLVVVSSALAIVLVIAIVVTILRSGSDESVDPVGEIPGDSAAPAPTVVAEEDEVVINPVVDPDFMTTLDEIVALEEGSGPESERIALDVPDSDLPAPSGSVSASLIFFDGSPQVFMTGPSRWLNAACIQTTVATLELESVDAAYHDTPTGVCGIGGIGRQSQVSCVGDDIIMLDVDLVDAGATSGSERLQADSVRVALVDFPPDFERLSLLGTIAIPDEFSVSDLPLARAPLGSELTVTLPEPDGDTTLTCLTR